MDFYYFYNSASEIFLKRMWKVCKQIMNEEMGLHTMRNRFRYKNYNYPLNVILFEHSTKLGHYNPANMELGLSKRLMTISDEVFIENIIRHELAHFWISLTFTDLGLHPHGAEFRHVCQSFGWGPEVYLAKTSIPLESQENETAVLGDYEEKIFDKVQKLLRLAAGQDIHEAQLAASKANELIYKYNLDKLGQWSDDVPTSMKRVLTAKKITPTLGAIYSILKHQHVYPVWNHFRGGVYLEVTGEKFNVKMADYLAAFLFNELERTWDQERKKHPSLRGIKAKTSFMDGLAKGFISKGQNKTTAFSDSNNQYQINNPDSKAMIPLAKQLEIHAKRVYPTLQTTYRKAQEDQIARGLGHQAGLKLQINPAITQDGNKTRKALIWTNAHDV